MAMFTAVPYISNLRPATSESVERLNGPTALRAEGVERDRFPGLATDRGYPGGAR
jgi:hypothetical protein